MATRIKFNGTGDGENDFEVHFSGKINDYTFCGLTLDGDPTTCGGYYVTKEKVNCSNCIQKVNYAKSIKKNEMI